MYISKGLKFSGEYYEEWHLCILTRGGSAFLRPLEDVWNMG